MLALNAAPTEDEPACGSTGAVDSWRRATDGSAVIDECTMTEDCPGYDRERQVCLIRPDDCEFAPAHGEAAAMLDTPAATRPDPSAETASQ